MRPDDLHVIVLTRAVQPLHGVGGLERHVHDLLRHLLVRGVRITLITRPATSTAAAQDFSHERLSTRFVPYWTFPYAGRRGTTVLDRISAYPLFGWRAGRLAADVVKGGTVNLVHGMGAASLGYAHARTADWFGTVPFVFNPHGMEEFGSTGTELDGLKRVAYGPLRKAVRLCAHAADRVVATDNVLVPHLLNHLGVSPARVAVVPNAVDLEAIDRRGTEPQAVRARLGLRDEEALLLGVGRLEHNKGFQHLVAALARLKSAGGSRPWRCVIVGEGPHRPALETAIASAGLSDAILLPGRVSEDELHAWYDAATLFVHPTLYEGSSIVTLEAMAHGRAIVASNAGGLPDKVRPGVNGWLLPPGDPVALAAALAEALGSPDRLATMGRESRAIVEQEFSWTAAASRLLALYDEILTSPPADVRGR